MKPKMITAVLALLMTSGAANAFTTEQECEKVWGPEGSSQTGATVRHNMRIPYARISGEP
jgi:hypothetical protein